MFANRKAYSTHLYHSNINTLFNSTIFVQLRMFGCFKIENLYHRLRNNVFVQSLSISKLRTFLLIVHLVRKIAYLQEETACLGDTNNLSTTQRRALPSSPETFSTSICSVESKNSVSSLEFPSKSCIYFHERHSFNLSPY